MLAPLTFADGSLVSPSIAFVTEPTLGFYRVGSAELGVTKNFTIATGFKLSADELNGGLFSAPDIKLKPTHSVTATEEPTWGNASDYGELAVNIPDKKVMVADEAGAVVVLANGVLEAPEDTKQYVRKDADWEEIVVPSEIPSGTKMLFYQAAAPTGWTIDATVTDHMLRVVDGTTLGGGVNGGTDNPVDNTHAHATAEHTLIESEMPAHTHDVYRRGNDGDYGGTQPCSTFNYITWTGFSCTGHGWMTGAGRIDTSGGDGPHDHGNTGDANWTPRFANVILCTKD